MQRIFIVTYKAILSHTGSHLIFRVCILLEGENVWFDVQERERERFFHKKAMRMSEISCLRCWRYWVNIHKNTSALFYSVRFLPTKNTKNYKTLPTIKMWQTMDLILLVVIVDFFFTAEKNRDYDESPWRVEELRFSNYRNSLPLCM